MQPPPPPLSIANFKKLVSQAELILVGRVISVKRVKEPDQPGRDKIEVTVEIKKLMKGEVLGDTVSIEEEIPIKKEIKIKGDSKIVGVQVGPSPYHGMYEPGEKILLMLVKNAGKDKYHPIGSGTYDKYLGEFLIKEDGITPLYFKFADDIKKYTGSQGKFIDLIEKILTGRNHG